MKKKVIKTNEMDLYLYPDNIGSLKQFVDEYVNNGSGFVQMQYLNDDAETNPFFVQEDIKTVFVNFANMTTIEEEEVFLMSDAEFEEQLAPFTSEICEGCAFDGNPDTGCDRILRKRDKINIIEEECFLYTGIDELEGAEYPSHLYNTSDKGKIFEFPGYINKKGEDDDE